MMILENFVHHHQSGEVDVFELLSNVILQLVIKRVEEHVEDQLFVKQIHNL